MVHDSFVDGDSIIVELAHGEGFPELIGRGAVLIRQHISIHDIPPDALTVGLALHAEFRHRPDHCATVKLIRIVHHQTEVDYCFGFRPNTACFGGLLLTECCEQIVDALRIVDLALGVIGKRKHSCHQITHKVTEFILGHRCYLL